MELCSLGLGSSPGLCKAVRSWLLGTGHQRSSVCGHCVLQQGVGQLRPVFNEELVSLQAPCCCFSFLIGSECVCVDARVPASLISSTPGIQRSN